MLAMLCRLTRSIPDATVSVNISRCQSAVIPERPLITGLYHTEANDQTFTTVRVLHLGPTGRMGGFNRLHCERDGTLQHASKVVILPASLSIVIFFAVYLRIKQ